MAQKNIDLGIPGDNDTGAFVFQAFADTQANFTELYNLKINKTGSPNDVMLGDGTTVLLSLLNPGVDTIPTNGSTKAVSSNGVFDALQLKANASQYLPLTGGQLSGTLSTPSNIVGTGTNSRFSAWQGGYRFLEVGDALEFKLTTADDFAWKLDRTNSNNAVGDLEVKTLLTGSANGYTTLYKFNASGTPSVPNDIATKLYVDGVVSNAGGGDMIKATYDQNNNGIVDNSTLLEGNTSAFHLDRVNHTGTQTAASISDFNTAVSSNTAVTLNTAKITNADHTGDVTGSTVLTLSPTGVTAGSYSSADITVDAKGRITAASTGSNALALDTVPTNGSSNAVESQGIFNSLSTKSNVSNTVTTNTNQSIVGFKDFSNRLKIDNGGVVIQTGPLTQQAGYVSIGGIDNNTVSIRNGAGRVVGLRGTGLTGNRNYTLPNQDGTLALLSDVSGSVTQTFTPNLIDNGGGATYPIGFSLGKYSVNGDVVTFSIQMTNIDTIGTPTGQLTLTGMPFNSVIPSAVSVNFNGGFDINFYSIQGITSGNLMRFSYQSSFDGIMDYSLSGATILPGTALYITGTYFK